MARRPVAEPIYQVADQFRRSCLTSGHSLLWPDRIVWTPANVRQVYDSILGNPDLRDRSFEEKLRDQLAPLSEDAHRVAVDALAFYYLFPDGTKPATKLSKLKEVSSWRLGASPPSTGIVEQAFQVGGIGSAGPRYNFTRPWQLGFILKFADVVLSTKPNLFDAGVCRKLADQILDEEPKAAESRNILLYLLFPESFERIVSISHKRQIVNTFSNLAPDSQDIEASLFGIRAALAATRGNPDLDFYDADLQKQWRKKASDDDISQNLQSILDGYIKARTSEAFNRSALMFQLFQRTQAAFEKTEQVTSRLTLSVKASAGQGNWAEVPWIAFFDSRETETIQEGVYGVFLFRSDMKGVYLTFNQGVTKLRNSIGRKAGQDELRRRASELRKGLAALAEQGFRLTDDIVLGGPGRLGEEYEASTIAHKFYPTSQLPAEEELLEDLEAVLEVYDEYLNKGASVPPAPPPRPPRDDHMTLLSAAVQDFGNSLLSAHVSFGAQHEQVVRSFIASLATKRFAILTGQSGSGKTQLAKQFGEWLGGEEYYQVIPVRPDWTGAEAVFGYEDALKEAPGGRRAWHVPDTLKIMLRAVQNPTKAYLMVLDEMNLAHVERYFADVLSGMESDSPCLPNLMPDAEDNWRLSAEGVARVRVPRNLFVVGTVNVDETTYMFSPKVLDRANTFEFRVGTSDLELGLPKPSTVKPGTPELVAGFLRIATDDNWHLAQPAPDQDRLSSQLKAVHAILAESGFEFGHRTFFEAIRFGAMLAAAGDPDPMHALDLQLMQKVLPRLHGSRRRLEGTLCALGVFCHDLSMEPLAKLKDVSARFDIASESSIPPVLPKTFEKVSRMLRALRINQFVSFTE